MDPKERDEKLEKWLDDALANYSDAEPQWGFEQRILAKVRAQEEPRRRWMRFWIPVLAAVAVAVVIAALVRVQVTHGVPQPERNTTASGTTKSPTIAPPSVRLSPAPNLSADKAAVPRVRVAARFRKSVEQLPRQAAFPAPTPMTAEERALMAIARRAPREAEKVATAEQEQPQAPQKLTIQAINIEPLEAVGFGGGRK